MKRIAVIAVLFLCLSARDGFVSQVIPEFVSLEELVQTSPFIVRAVPANPASITREISIGWFKPSFTLCISRYGISEVLAGSDRRIAGGKTIEVYPAQWQWRFGMHRDYHTRGMSVSPIINSYRPDVPPDEQGEVILFLRTNADDQLELAADRAYESPSKHDEIRRLLNELPRGK
jgi:hypothetical protein